MGPRKRTIRPFAAGGRRTIGSILILFTLFSALGLVLSTSATERSQHRAAVLQVAARQRTLAERYVEEVLSARSGLRANPALVADLLNESARALIEGGTAPAVNGDDDETVLSPTDGNVARAQLLQERRLVTDLTETGKAILAHDPVDSVPQTANEKVTVADPVQRLRVLATLSSNVSLNAARTIATRTDQDINDLLRLEIGVGLGSVVASLLLGWALIAATRRQGAHFRSLVRSSTDLVVVIGDGGCRYASESVSSMIGQPDDRLLGDGFMEFVHPDDRASVTSACSTAEPRQIEFLLSAKFGEWRHVEAHVSDLRKDRHLRSVVLNARDITERVRLEKELTHQAFHDALTGLANRALYSDRLNQALARSGRSRDPLAVLIIDLDRFKQVNDSLGHGSGDKLLQQLASRFAAMTRPSDTLARLGGDEFAMLLDGAREPEALAIAQRLLERLLEPVTIEGRNLVLGASIGIALHRGGAATAEELVRQADVAMYVAKRNGGAQVEVFQSTMGHEVGELLHLEHDLRDGLQRGELIVHYQPEIDLDTNELVGLEALVRWESPTRGLVLPDQFIPIAEATGLIIPLGESVLDQACEQTAQWLRDGLITPPFTTWVNLSGKQLSSGGVSDIVRRALERTGLPPECLGLEVTETAIVVEGPAGERALAELDDVHSLGVRIAIDDFGTGFSSLAQLRRFPIDVIKVDRSFIQGMEHDPKSAVITSNLASLAHALGMVAIAEGIETQGQRTACHDLGCDLAQGYLFARPGSVDQVTRLLTERRAEERRTRMRDVANDERVATP